MTNRLEVHAIDPTNGSPGQIPTITTDGSRVEWADGGGSSGGGGSGDANWTAPTFQNGWANYDATTYATAAYRKDGNGFVHLRGLVKGGTAQQPMFTLPVGYRPSKILVFVIISNQTIGQLNIYPDGRVAQVVGSPTAPSISGVSFFAEA